MKLKILLMFCVVFFLLAYFFIRPIHIPNSIDECLSVKGIVSEVYEGGTKDIVFRLKDDDRMYYINRGLERGLTLTELKKELIWNVAELKYPEQWSPLDPGNHSVHLSAIIMNDKIVFSEIGEN